MLPSRRRRTSIYPGAIKALRDALEVVESEELRVGLAEAYLGEARRLTHAAKLKEAQGNPKEAARLRKLAQDMRISSGSHLNRAPDQALKQAAALHAAGNRRASIDLYRATLIASGGKSEGAREGLAKIYGEFSRANVQRARHRDMARGHLLKLKSSSDPKVAARAKRELRKMAADVPLMSQIALGNDLMNDASVASEHRQVNRGNAFCGITSFAMIARAEGAVDEWTPKHTAHAAYGAGGLAGAYVPGAGTAKSLLAPLSELEFGFPASQTGAGTSANIRSQIESGRPVMVGGGPGRMVPTARYKNGAWEPVTGAAAGNLDVSYASHWFVVTGYTAPSEQTAAERARSGGRTLWHVQDPMRAARLEIPDGDFQAYTKSDRDKFMVRFGTPSNR